MTHRYQGMSVSADRRRSITHPLDEDRGEGGGDGLQCDNTGPHGSGQRTDNILLLVLLRHGSQGLGYLNNGTRHVQ